MRTQHQHGQKQCRHLRQPWRQPAAPSHKATHEAAVKSSSVVHVWPLLMWPWLQTLLMCGSPCLSCPCMQLQDCRRSSSRLAAWQQSILRRRDSLMSPPACLPCTTSLTSPRLSRHCWAALQPTSSQVCWGAGAASTGMQGVGALGRGGLCYATVIL